MAKTFSAQQNLCPWVNTHCFLWKKYWKLYRLKIQKQPSAYWQLHPPKTFDNYYFLQPLTSAAENSYLSCSSKIICLISLNLYLLWPYVLFWEDLVTGCAWRDVRVDCAGELYGLVMSTWSQCTLHSCICPCINILGPSFTNILGLGIVKIS